MVVTLLVKLDMHEFVRTCASFVLPFSHIFSRVCKSCNIKFYYNCVEVRRRAETTEKQWQQAGADPGGYVGDAYPHQPFSAMLWVTYIFP